MRTIAIDRFGGPEELTPHDLPAPQAGPGEVVVRVAYAGVNPVDYKMRDGSSKWVRSLGPDAFPLVLGREMSGVVESVGDGVRDLAPGDRVFGFTDAGCYAELVATAATNVARVPDGVELRTAGGLAAAGLTAVAAVEELGRVGADDVVLIHGAGGGVGQVATQLALAHGAHVYASASARHHDTLRRWGAEPIDYQTHDVGQAAADPRPNVIIDGVYFGTYEPSIAMLAPGDRLVVLPTLADLEPARRAGLEVGCPAISGDRATLDRLAAMVGDGSLEIVVSEVFPLERAADAHRLVEGGHARGKVLLEV